MSLGTKSRVWTAIMLLAFVLLICVPLAGKVGFDTGLRVGNSYVQAGLIEPDQALVLATSMQQTYSVLYGIACLLVGFVSYLMRWRNNSALRADYRHLELLSAINRARASPNGNARVEYNNERTEAEASMLRRITQGRRN